MGHRQRESLTRLMITDTHLLLTVTCWHVFSLGGSSAATWDSISSSFVLSSYCKMGCGHFICTGGSDSCCVILKAREWLPCYIIKLQGFMSVHIRHGIIYKIRLASASTPRSRKTWQILPWWCVFSNNTMFPNFLWVHRETFSVLPSVPCRQLAITINFFGKKNFYCCINKTHTGI